MDSPTHHDLAESAQEASATEPSVVESNVGAAVRGRKRRSVTPWVGSILIHGLLVVIALNVTLALRNASVEEEEAIFTLALSSSKLSADPKSRALESIAADARPQESARLDPSAPRPVEAPLMDAAIREMFKPAESAGMLPAASAAPAGTGTAPGLSAVSFSGLKAIRARSVAFVIDASGSMIGALPAVIDELERSLSAMQPDQAFRVIFFQRNGMTEPPDTGLGSATAEHRAAAVAWARKELIPTGRSNPLKAIETALADRPDVIFLLGTTVTGAGEYEISGEQLRERLEAMNPVNPATGRRAVQIQCIQLLDEDPDETLKKIAATHGGSKAYRYVSRSELGLKSP